MDKITFILMWILSSLPIVYRVNKRMEYLKDEARHETGFQIFLFIRAQLEVPKFYFMTILNLITPKHK